MKGNSMIDSSKFLTLENAKDYATTKDKLLFCEYLTDLPFQSKALKKFEYEMFVFALNLGLVSEDD